MDILPSEPFSKADRNKSILYSNPLIMILPVIPLLVILTVISSISAVNGQQSPITYENTTLGISFHYPSSWHLYNYKNGIIISFQELSNAQVIPIFSKNKITIILANTNNQKSPSDSTPPVLVQIYTKFTDKTLQETASEITHAIGSVWSGAGTLTSTTVFGSPAYSLRVNDINSNVNALLIWGIKPITKVGYTGISKQYNVAYITEGFDFDIYKNDFDSILNSLRFTQDDEQIVRQYETVKVATENDKEAFQLYNLQIEQKEKMQRLQAQHNDKVVQEFERTKSCDDMRNETGYRLARLKNTTGEEKDDLQMTLNYFQSRFDNECKGWQPTTNLTIVPVPGIQYPQFIPNPILEYGPN